VSRNVAAASSFSDQLEESVIAVLLGLMTIITFSNVVARYVFNDNILWALEATVFLFAWMVLLGASYCVKKSLHLGVDIMVVSLSPQKKKMAALFAVAVSLIFSLLLLKGSWDYWYPFVTKRAFLEVNDIPMPDFLQFLAAWLNEGELYEKIPRFIPYAVLPISMTLLTWRLLQAGWSIAKGNQTGIIASHEVEEQLQEIGAAAGEER
jgi:C4-dicarboxylate transporter DctQ subunit